MSLNEACALVQMLQKPLGDAAGKDILSELLQLLPELFDENIKAVKLIGASIGGMLTSKQLTPVDVRLPFHSMIRTRLNLCNML